VLVYQVRLADFFCGKIYQNTIFFILKLIQYCFTVLLVLALLFEMMDFCKTFNVLALIEKFDTVLFVVLTAFGCLSTDVVLSALDLIKSCWIYCTC
jgi:hypothetical protein